MSEEKKSTEPAAVSRAYKRSARNLLIHRPMQREFTFVMIGLLMVSTLVIGYVIHTTIREAAFGGGFHFGKINPYEVLYEVRYQLLVRTFLVLFTTIVVLGIFGIFFLHRVAGPLHRIHRVFLKINDGEVHKISTPILLREGDFFQETALEINHMIRKMQFEENQHKLMKQKLDQIISSGGNETAARAAREVKTLLDQPFEDSHPPLAK